MFEKEAEEYYYKKVFAETNPKNETELKEKFLQTFKDSAEFGYNKANEWHYVKDGDLPKHDHEVLCILWGDTREIGYYKNEVWYFENFSADNEDVDYWQEIVLPELKEIE